MSVGALALLVAAIGIALLFRSDQIDARAVRLVSTQDWMSLQGGVWYFWLRGGNLLYFAKSDAGHVTAFRQRVVPAGMSQQPVAVNVFPTAPPWQPFDLSPDEKWLTCAKPMPGQAGIFVIPLAGPKGRFTPSYLATSRSWWSPDSGSLIHIELSPSPQLDTRNRIGLSPLPALGSLVFHITLNYPDGRKPETIALPREVDGYSWYEGLSCVLPSGSLLLRRDRDSNYGSMRLPASRKVTFAEIDSLNAAAAPRIWSVPIPKDALRGDLSISPRGDRILWMLEISGVTPIETWLRHIMPQRKWRSGNHVVWRVSRLDGSDMHGLGRYDSFDISHYGATWIWPQWTPDGKNLSFIKNGSLYLLPAY